MPTHNSIALLHSSSSTSTGKAQVLCELTASPATQEWPHTQEWSPYLHVTLTSMQGSSTGKEKSLVLGMAVVDLTSTCPGLCRYHVRAVDKQGRPAVQQSTYLIVTSGILAEQHTLQERGIHNTDSYRGIITYAGRHNDADSIVNTDKAKDKVVVILGTGAFACEAMEASLRNGAKHVHLLSRERIR